MNSIKYISLVFLFILLMGNKVVVAQDYRDQFTGAYQSTVVIATYKGTVRNMYDLPETIEEQNQTILVSKHPASQNHLVVQTGFVKSFVADISKDTFQIPQHTFEYGVFSGYGKIQYKEGSLFFSIKVEGKDNKETPFIIMYEGYGLRKGN